MGDRTQLDPGGEGEKVSSGGKRRLNRAGIGKRGRRTGCREAEEEGTRDENKEERRGRWRMKLIIIMRERERGRESLATFGGGDDGRRKKEACAKSLVCARSLSHPCDNNLSCTSKFLRAGQNTRVYDGIR